MNNFEYYAPTKVVFGRDAAAKAGEEAAKAGAHRVLIVYGSDRVLKNGLLDRVRDSLTAAGITSETFGGVKPNPLLSHARDGVVRAINMDADLILAIGGGSVIDTAKAIAHGKANPQSDLWDLWLGRAPLNVSTPVGVVLTMPAAGSEMSDSAVLTNEDTSQKKGLGTPLNRCRFALMDPSAAQSLPDWQLTNGIVDIMMHTMERYFISGIQCEMTDCIAEGLLRTVRDSGRRCLADRTDYDAMAEIWWCSSLSHNGLTDCGRGKDFSVHKFGMALSAFYDYTHGATLSAVWASWARYLYKDAPDRFARYARNVWGISETDDLKAAVMGIDATEEYFREIGMPVSLHELGLDHPDDETLRKLALHATSGDTVKLSRIRPLTSAEVIEIYRMAE